MNRIETTVTECVNWIRKYFEETGGEKAVIGISGGKDSTVAAALCVEALGAENVIGVMMPKAYQSDIKDAHKIVEYLGIKWYCIDICDPFDEIIKEIAIFTDLDISNQTKINLAPLLRMATLYAIAQSCNGRVCNTCNYSEDFVGYSTLYGDLAGDFSPLGKLFVSDIIKIGDFLGLPKGLVHKIPSDGLCGLTDEDNLGFTYDELERYIKGDRNCEHSELIEKKINASRFKREMIKIPTFDNL